MKKVCILITLLFSFNAWGQSNTDLGATLVDIQQAASKIREKERELMDKETELNAREARLNALEQDLITREEQLAAIRKEVSKMLDQINESNNEEIEKLAKLYSSTKPKQAASVLIKMDLEQTAAIIGKIPSMTAGKIMAEIAKQDATYASKLSSKMAGEQVNLSDIESANTNPVPR